MGNTVWVLKQGQEEDDRDHTLMLSQEKALDRLAKKLKVKKLTELYDYSVLNEEFGGPDADPNYIAPASAKETLVALIEAIKSGNSDVSSSTDLVEELEDCLKKVVEGEDEQCNIRLSIIP